MVGGQLGMGPSGRRIRCGASSRAYEIFRYRPGPEVTLEAAQDAYTICRSITDPRQKEACYAVLGVNGDAVERYLPLILALEKECGLKDDPVDVFEFRWGEYILKIQHRGY